MGLTTGDIIDDKYRIVRLIGEGGMGAVYEGENLRIHRTVAIKVLHAGVAQQSDAVQRFEREAQAAGRIGSEHIVEVLDLGNLPNGDRYMVMEFMDGDTLSDRIHESGRLTPAQLYPVVRQMLDGLSAAHGAGIIHRDLKPDNVFLLKSRRGQQDFVKLLDFGISKFSALSGDTGFSMTRTGAVMGTPYYMSPEQAKGAKNMDHRADLYGVGVILYESVTGQVPFNADTFNELLFKIVLEQPAPVEQLAPDIDPGFAALIVKAMAREAAHRYQTAEEFQQALDAWAQTGVGPTEMAAQAGVPGARAASPSVVTPGQPLQTSTPGQPLQTSTPGQPLQTSTPGQPLQTSTPGQPLQTSTPGQPLQTGTPGAWSSSGSLSGSGSMEPAQKKSKVGMLVGIGAVALVVLVGGGAAALHFRDTAAAAREQAAREAASANAQRRAEKAAAKEAAKQKAALDKAVAEKDKLEQEAAAAKKKAESEKSAAKKAAAEDDAKKKEAAAEAAAARKREAMEAFQRAQRNKQALTRKTPAPTATSKGRVIRTSL